MKHTSEENESGSDQRPLVKAGPDEEGQLALVPAPPTKSTIALQWLLALAMVASFAWFGYLRDAVMLATAVTGCLVGLVAVRFAGIKRLKGPGFEVEMHQLAKARAHTVKVTEEAKATLAQVRELGASLARLSLDSLARANLHGEFPWSDKIRLRDNLKHQLKDLGVESTTIDEADGTFQELLRFRFASRVVEAAQEVCLVTRGGVADDAYMQFQKKMQDVLDFRSLSVPTADHLRVLIGEHVDDDVEDRLREYEHFLSTGMLPRPTCLDGVPNEIELRSTRVTEKIDRMKRELAE